MNLFFILYASRKREYLQRAPRRDSHIRTNRTGRCPIARGGVARPFGSCNSSRRYSILCAVYAFHWADGPAHLMESHNCGTPSLNPKSDAAAFCRVLSSSDSRHNTFDHGADVDLHTRRTMPERQSGQSLFPGCTNLVGALFPFD